MNRDPAHRRNILEPLEILGVDAFAESGVIIRMRFKTRPLFQWMIGREFRRRVKNRFDELGIEIPYPHRTLYFGTDKQGRAAPARVSLQQPAAAVGEPGVDEPLPEAALLARSRGG
jgi:small-conductance mechanosensitive channel